MGHAFFKPSFNDQKTRGASPRTLLQMYDLLKPCRRHFVSFIHVFSETVGRSGYLCNARVNFTKCTHHEYKNESLGLVKLEETGISVLEKHYVDENGLTFCL